MIRIGDPDGVRVITFDRPERRNALTPDGLDALEAAVADELAARDAETLRVVERRVRDDSPKRDQQRREAEAFGRLAERRADAIADR